MDRRSYGPATFIDLFAGCGGFSLGLESAGLKCIAAIDFDDSAIQTYINNHPHVPYPLVKDLTKFNPDDLDRLLGSQRVQVVVGGPPCQGFSKARQVDGANHGRHFVRDPRRDLYRDFLRFVGHYQPSVFVMENVDGIRSAAGGVFFTGVQAESREHGYRVISLEIKAWRFGVPQKRVRQFIIGTRRELPLFIPHLYLRPTHADPETDLSGGLEPMVTLGEAIGDLPEIIAGDERFGRPYDDVARKAHLHQYGDRFIYGVLQAHKTRLLTGHSARRHSPRDMRDFVCLQEGETSRRALARGAAMEFPYNRESFQDRYTKQHRDQLCSTIVAHLKKDGLMFIHPTQVRSLTPREAARIQSFPDTFHFPEERTNAYAQIGNAVPPLVAQAVGRAINEYLMAAVAQNRGGPKLDVRLPTDRGVAIGLLEKFVDSVYWRPLTAVTKRDFLEAWWAVGYLHPQLHPDAVADNGDEVSRGIRRDVSFVLEPVYTRSGWPAELVPIATEARRRFESQLLSEDEYYYSAAIIAGCSDSSSQTKTRGFGHKTSRRADGGKWA